MKISYNPERNIAYIQLKEKDQEVEARQLADDIVADIAADGTFSVLNY